MLERVFMMRDERDACRKLVRDPPVYVELRPVEIVRAEHERCLLRVAGIRKTYGRTVAVDEVSFEVAEGEIFGLIGPNGAGKTTTLECVEGLRTPDAGTISVLALDPFRDAYALQNRIGVQLQEAQLQKRIKVWEAVDLWASLFP